MYDPKPVANVADTLDSDHPELQAKIRRCVEQGHIDPEDFRGVSLKSRRYLDKFSRLGLSV